MSFSAFICADWGKLPGKRVAYVGDVADRTISLLRAEPSFEGMVHAAYSLAKAGPVLLGFDVPIGVPASFLAQFEGTFVDLLWTKAKEPSFFTSARDARDWSPQRPFFCVPPGKGGLTRFDVAARAFGVELYRAIERTTNGKSLFVTSGIPGTVGSSVCALWPEIGRALSRDRSFALWPFEGSLDDVASLGPVVVAEVYPRAVYAAALSTAVASERSRMSVAKTQPAVRAAAMAVLRDAAWVRTNDVTLRDQEYAIDSEDAFDALMTAAALLRCHLEGCALHGEMVDPIAEGGILCTGSMDLSSPERPFRLPSQHVLAARRPQRQRAPRPSRSPIMEGIRCPISGCSHVFRSGRLGWDAHAASLTTHPQWRTDLRSGHDRKQAFRSEYPDFFR